MIAELPSRFGTFFIEEQNNAIVRITLPTLAKVEATTPPSIHSPVLREACRQMNLYMEGKLRKFDLPLSPYGTPFMLSVWEELKKIPYAATASYKDIATALGNPKASRAVGMANNRNPIPIIIPCHRVIGSHGAPVGYAGGIPLKQQLLSLEAHAHF